MLIAYGRDALSVDSPKMEAIEGNRLLQAGQIRRNPAPMAGLIGFQRVAVLGIGSFGRGPSMIDNSACIGYFSHF